MMSLTFGLFTQVSGSGPLGPLVLTSCKEIPLVFLTGLILSCKAVLGDIGSNLV